MPVRLDWTDAGCGVSPEDSAAFTRFCERQRQRWSMRCLRLEQRVRARRVEAARAGAVEWAQERRRIKAMKVPALVQRLGMGAYER